jgi:hypothetical protein
MKLVKKAGSTSEIWQIFIQSTAAFDGSGLTGLTNASSGLTAYYHRDTDTTATAISLVSMTVGTFTSSGFKEIDATNMPGWYQFCPPNAALASGAKSCAIHLKGATNMAAVPIEVQLTAVDADSATAFITGVNSLAPPTNWNLLSVDSNGRVDVIKINGTSQTARDLGASVLLSSGTGTGQLDFTSGVVKANTTQVSGTAQTARDLGASVLLSSGTGTGQLDFTSGVVKANATQFAGQTITAAAGVTLPATVASTTNITAGTITTVTNLTNAPTSGDFTATMKTSLNAATPAVTVSDKTGFSLSSAGVQAIWDALTSALSTASSIGKLLVDNVNATITSRLASGTVASDVTAIKAKTDNLPAAPAAVSDIPTATQNADALLKRDMSAVTGEATRSPLNALRWLRNKWSYSSGTMTVTKEDDTTTAWTATVTQTAGNPVTGVDPG